MKVKEVIFILIFLSFSLLSCRERKSNNPLISQKLEGCWVGGLLQNERLTEDVELPLFKIKPDSSLVFSLTHETGLRSRVWEYDIEISIQNNEISWLAHQGRLSENLDTIYLTKNWKGEQSQWMFYREKSYDDFISKFISNINSDYTYSIPVTIMDSLNCASLDKVGINTIEVAAEQDISYRLYPHLYDSLPIQSSPCIVLDTIETIIVVTKNKQYGIVPVTLENGKPLIYSYKTGTSLGKDKQLEIGTADFPSLARNGLHNEEELAKKKMITGIPTDVINCTAKPNGYSYAGFLAEDEDIVSVLIGDNRLVGKMKLTHPQLAKPLFHIWNLILIETELGNWARFYDNIKEIHYNGNILNFKASGSKGWQQSIFFDEIQGRYNIHIDRELTPTEFQFLKRNYPDLPKEEFDKMVYKLTTLDFSEMLPYYIMRYGFYEGHTDYRCDPIAIAFIFGLKSIEEINSVFDGNLYNYLTKHYISLK